MIMKATINFKDYQSIGSVEKFYVLGIFGNSLINVDKVCIVVRK